MYVYMLLLIYLFPTILDLLDVLSWCKRYSLFVWSSVDGYGPTYYFTLSLNQFNMNKTIDKCQF